jgi:formylglycine-generating enzyme required for sulfatase activity
MRALIYGITALLVVFSAELLNADSHSTRNKKVVILDVRIENDIGVENSGMLMTKWLTDSVSRAAPHLTVIRGSQAAELARLKLPIEADEISPSVARNLMKSIEATHVLGSEIFLWGGKYGVTLRLVELSNTSNIRVERGLADAVDDIPAKIEKLAYSLFSEAKTSSKPDSFQKTTSKSIEAHIPEKAVELLSRHQEMVYVPAGEFRMGNDDDSDAENMPVDPSRREGVSRLVLLAAEKPEHVVYVDAFLMDRYEVTNAEFKRFKPDHGFAPDKANYPVTGISWYDATEYAKWAGKRLPTDKEWERAARGDDGRKWPWGNVFRRGYCNLGADIAPVGSFDKDRSPYGVYDMAANIQEWTSSDFAPYSGNKDKNIDFDSKKKVVRGSYYGGNDFLARCSMRFCALPGTSGKKPEAENYKFIGFRCVKDIE